MMWFGVHLSWVTVSLEIQELLENQASLGEPGKGIWVSLRAQVGWAHLDVVVLESPVLVGAVTAFAQISTRPKVAQVF